MVTQERGTHVYAALARDLLRDSGDAVVLLVDVGSADVVEQVCAAAPQAPALVLLLGQDEVPEAWRARFGPQVQVTTAPSAGDRVLRIATLDHPVRLVVEHDGRSGAPRPSAFKFLFWTLAAGGRYALRDTGGASRFRFDDRADLSVREFLAWLDAEDPQPAERTRAATIVRELRTACGTTTVEDGVVVVEKANDHVVKVRDWEADDLFTERWGDAWGRSVVRLPAYGFDVPGEVQVLGTGPLDGGQRRIEVPERHLRRYDDVQLSWRLLLLKDNLVLPDAFRHRHQRRLNQARLVNATPRMARPLLPPRRRTIEGDHFLLDSEYPAHFGHVMTEVLGMMWGWRETRRRVPGVRPIVTLNPRMEVLPEFVLQIFEGCGVARDEIEYVRNDEAVHIERLWAATPQMESPQWIDRDLTTTWRALAAGIAERSGNEPGLGADRVFVSRRPGGKRDCLNTDEVEAFFRRLGFAIYFPEDHSYAHQVATFAAARRIAGFGGSGMFGIVFAPQAKVLVLASENYTANNEYLLAAANGNDIAYVWGPAEIQARPDGLWDSAAFKSDFTVPLRPHRRAIKRFLR